MNLDGVRHFLVRFQNAKLPLKPVGGALVSGGWI
jgi:hypothetical protein